MPIEIKPEELDSIVKGIARSPYQITYFNQPRVLQKLRAASAKDESLTLHQLIQAEYLKLGGPDFKLMMLGYSPDEFADLNPIKREALLVAKCEPEQLRELTDLQARALSWEVSFDVVNTTQFKALNRVQVEGIALGVPYEFVTADWFNETRLRAVRDGAPCELVAPLDADISSSAVALMDELLARLALKLAAHPDQETILKNWNETSHVSGKELRIHLAALTAPHGKLYTSKVASVVKNYHKPQFTERGLASFTQKILEITPLAARNEASVNLNNQLTGLQTLARRADLSLEAKFTALLKGYDAYQAGLNALQRKPSPRLFRSPLLSARRMSDEAEAAATATTAVDKLEGFSLGVPALKVPANPVYGAFGLAS